MKIPSEINIPVMEGPTTTHRTIHWATYCAMMDRISSMSLLEYETRVPNFGLHNISSYPLSFLEKKLLSNGLGFIPAPKAATNLDLMQDFNSFARAIRIRHMFAGSERPLSANAKKLYIPNSSFQPKRASAPVESLLLDRKKALAKQLFTSKDTPPLRNLCIGEQYALRNLAANKSIMIRNADKNLGPTVMDESWVRSESLRQLSDTTTYKSITDGVPLDQLRRQLTGLVNKFLPPLPHQDPASTSRRKLRQFLFSCSKTDETGKGCRIPIFYIIPKLHKSPVVGRPICSSVNWITTPCSIFLDTLLRELLCADIVPSYLKDSTDLLRLLEQTPIPKNAILVTMDICSLYPSIPLDEGISALRYFVFQHLHCPHKDKLLIMALTQWVLRNNYISFMDLTFKQIRGVAMGTPFAVIFSVLYIAFLERDFTDHQEVLVFKRFIDDIFMVWTGNEQDLGHYLTSLNKRNPAIQFTWEFSSSSIPFMDIQISKGSRFHSSGFLDTSTYQKTLNQYAYISFRSFHPPSQKLAFINGELTRYIRNSSSLEDYLLFKKLFFKRLLLRGYPRGWLRKVFSKKMYFKRKDILWKQRKDVARAPIVFKTVYTPRHRHLRFGEILTLTPGSIPNQHHRATLCLKKSKSLRQHLCRSRHPTAA